MASTGARTLQVTTNWRLLGTMASHWIPGRNQSITATDSGDTWLPILIGNRFEWPVRGQECVRDSVAAVAAAVTMAVLMNHH